MCVWICVIRMNQLMRLILHAQLQGALLPMVAWCSHVDAVDLKCQRQCCNSVADNTAT